MIFCEIKTNME